jgi:hypothetical protein
VTVAVRKNAHRRRKPLASHARVDWANSPDVNGGLLCWYPFNEGGGSRVYDLTGRQAAGTFQNSPAWGVGQYGPGVVFDQTAVKLINLPTITGFDPNEGTIALGVSHLNTTAFQNIFLFQLDNNNKFEFYNGMGSAGVQLNFVRHGNNSASTDSANYTDQETGVWKRYVLTWSVAAGFARIYSNGALRASQALTQTWVGGVPATNYYGGNSSASRSLVGTGDGLRIWNRALPAATAARLTENPFAGAAVRKYWGLRTASAAATCALSGTVTASITESDIVAGGKTIILTLTGDTWVAAGGTFDAQRQNIINGIDSAQAEATGWDAVVKAGLAVSAVVRTSATVVTVTLPAFATYNITANETITATIPSTALSGGAAITASPTFTVSANSPLVAGALSLTSRTISTAALSWTNSTGGVGSVTQQLQRKTGAGGTYADVSGGTSSPKTDTGLTQNTVYYYRVRYTDSDSPTPQVVYSNEVLVRTWTAVTDTSVFCSPYNTYSDGAGALQANNVRANATYALWTNAGAYLRFKATVGAAGTVALKLDESCLAGVTGNQCPILKYTYGTLLTTGAGGPATAGSVQLSSATTSVTLASGLAAGTYVFEVHVRSMDYSGTWDRWVTPQLAVKVVGLQVDDDAVTATPPIRTKNLLVYGASHDEGVQILGISSGIADNDATQSSSVFFARAFDAEYGIVAYAGQGFVKGIDRVAATSTHPSLKNATAANESWDKYFSGASRLVGGLFSPAPDYVKVDTGTNDYSLPLAGTDVTPFLNALRTAVGSSAWIFVSTDIAGSQSAALDAGAAAAAVQTRLVRLRPTILIKTSNGFTSTEQAIVSYDSATNGAHPNVQGTAPHGAEEVYLAKTAIDAATGTGSGYSRGRLVNAGGG